MCVFYDTRTSERARERAREREVEKVHVYEEREKEEEEEASLGRMGVAQRARSTLFCLSLGPQCRRRED